MTLLFQSLLTFSVVVTCLNNTRIVDAEESAEVVLLGGKVLTMDSQNRIVSAVAIRDGRIIDTGADEKISRLQSPRTKIVQLGGATVIPGIIAAHCHAVGVARSELDQPHVELLTIAQIQQWIRERAQTLPAGTWILVARANITRLKERQTNWTKPVLRIQ